jgi:DNA-binding winged helix-turn-helix (wHTH) protein
VPVETPNEIAFGPFLLDRRAHRLAWDGAAVPLGRRALDGLAALAALAGDVLRKGALLDPALSGLTVDENDLQVQASALRKAMGEAWIVTVPVGGHRLAHPDSIPTMLALALLDKPSLIVLLFQNMSVDPRAEIFRRWLGRGHHQGTVLHSHAVRDRAQFGVRYAAGPARPASAWQV